MQPFDDRDGFIWYNGRLVPWRDAKLHVLSHGLHYGSSVFEGERAYSGKIFKSREHSARLHRSAELLGFKLPYTTDQLEAAKLEVLKANGMADAYVRAFAWRGSEKMAISASNTNTHVAIAVWEMPSYFPEELKKNGLKLCWATYKRPSPETAPSEAKAAGLYMICTLSKHKAEAEGFHDALMLDYRGYVAEATGANFFMTVNGELHTPTPDCFLNGITRLTMIDLAKKRGIKVVERHIKPEELASGQEAFLTGTAAEITPIGSVGDYKFTPGPVTAQLVADYEKLTRS